MVFSASGDYLVSGDEDRVRVWRVDDRKKVATMTAKLVQCLAVSSDGMWIAAGTTWSGFIVWSTKTYEKVLTLEEGTVITGLDFSPDSTRLVTASDNRTAAVWDITTRDRLLLLRHKDDVIAAKYAPQGDRIATATRHSVRFYDSDEGHLLAEAQVKHQGNSRTVLPSGGKGTSAQKLDEMRKDYV